MLFLGREEDTTRRFSSARYSLHEGAKQMKGSD